LSKNEVFTVHDILDERELRNQLCRFHKDTENHGNWITVNGQYLKVHKNGEVVSGNPKVPGGKSKKCCIILQIW